LTTARRRRLPFPSALPARRAGDAWRLEADGRELRLSNLDKVYWPADGITKGDLLAYYWNVADLLLPHLRDRPLTMKRMPNGLAGEPFYEKQVPAHAPDWLPTAAVPTEEDSRVVEFVLAQDRASLLYVVNLGCIEMHPLHSRAGSLDRPDYAFFDLDPFEPYTYEDVRTVAKLVKVVLDGLGLRGYAKTSGATGMQVFVPLDGTHTHTDAREFVERVGRLVVRAYPEKATMAWPVADRAGKIFIDHQMNRSGANIASVYSLRPLPRAPVSTPLDWEELDTDIEPGDFRIDNVWDRFAEGDRFEQVLTDKQSLIPAMEALGLTPGAEEASRERSRPRFPAKRTTRPAARSSLDEYVAKRDFQRTPEPGPPVGAPEPHPPVDGAPTGRVAEAGNGGERLSTGLPEEPHPAGLTEVAPLVEGRRFTIQQHHARRLHHDVRFEEDGVLVSFAVPKRLPEEPGVRHLAVNTEDHPLDYLTFSGSIPAGEYGGGEVRLFDLGTYEPLEVADGKLTVRLHGTRYKGAEYHLFRTRDRDWLVTLKGKVSLPQPPPPPTYEPMMAVLTSEPFDDDGWLFEVKWDGHRCLANLGTSTRLTSRTTRDMTAQFPELIDLHRQLAARNAVVDGEIVALDREGRPSFERMQDRFHRTPEELARHKGRVPVQFLAFDLLWLDGQPLLDLPLVERQARLAEVLVETGDIRLSQVVEGAGREFFDQVRALQLEGIVAKRAASPYRPGIRSHDWRKIKALCLQDCVIVGWTPGKGGRAATLGSLLLAVYDDGKLRYAGNVGTGFTHAFLADLLAKLAELEVPRPLFEGFEGTLRPRGARFVRPELVCEVEYLRWTQDDKLRASSFKGLRPDKPPTDARREHPVARPS
jgi:DNA ligase D-like protein (predicted ligase)/DNA ligase D-like protein (predicted polymerase)/DNA ligase D-like protein (predicted 3'-phosphoesterase)